MRNRVKKLFEAVDTVVITGGSSGIGECFIRRLYTVKRDLFICNISRSEPDRFPSPERMLHIPCDLGDPAALRAAAAKAEKWARERRGKVLLINNSGFGSYGPFATPTLDQHLDMIEVNAKAPVHLTGLLLPLLRERGGIVINVASTAAFQPTPYMATYGATKAFLLHWSLSLAEDLRPDGVHVLAVCPGPTSTRFFQRAGFEQPIVSDRFGQSSDQVVDATFRALARGKTVVVSGMHNKLLTAVASRLPKGAAARLAEVVLRRFRMQRLR
jgi:uncharacterized protein